MSEVRTVEWVNGYVRMIDQTRLPYQFVYVNLKNYREVAKAIRDMTVRGAPAIGVAAAMGMALAANASRTKGRKRLIAELEAAAEVLRRSRPTARNLFWGVEVVLRRAETTIGGAREVAAAVVKQAQEMAEEDVQANRKIGEYGACLLDDGNQILTHCNTGTLATVSYGTALAPIRSAIR